MRLIGATSTAELPPMGLGRAISRRDLLAMVVSSDDPAASAPVRRRRRPKSCPKLLSEDDERAFALPGIRGEMEPPLSPVDATGDGGRRVGRRRLRNATERSRSCLRRW
jgi:hypothetical protein